MRLIARLTARDRPAMPSNVGDAYTQLISDQLAEERARKTSIEQRGVGVITTSGALVTLLFGLSTLATKSQDYVLPDPARWTLLIAVALFFVASVLGLVTNWALSYDEVTTGAMEKLVKPDNWSAEATEAARQAAEARAAIIRSFRSNNQFKGWMLRAAMGFEILAVATLAVSVAIVLWVR